MKLTNMNKKNKRAQMTLTSVALYLVLAMGVFSGLYIFVGENMEDAGIEVPERYQNSSAQLAAQSDNLDEHLKEIKTSFNNVQQAESTAFAVWNGLVGLGSLLLLPITFVSIGVSTLSALILGDYSGYIPEWVILGLSSAVLIIILFTVIGALKGEGRL